MAEGRSVGNEEKRIVKDKEFLRPLKHFEGDSAEDTEDDQFEDLLSALNEVKDLRKQLNGQNQSLNEELERLSEAVCIENARSESLTQNVEKLVRKADEVTKSVKNDSLKAMRDQLNNNVEDFFSALSEIAILLDKASEQQQSLTQKVAFLSKDVGIEVTQTEALKKEIEELGQLQIELYNTDSLETYQSQLDELTDEWEDIVKNRRELSSDNLQGDLGMIAVYVEQAICAYVMPEVFLNDDGARLHNLLNFLNSSNKSLPLDPSEYNYEKILSEARKRWVIVCENFNFPSEWKTKTGGWNVNDYTVPGDIRAMEVLRMSGVNINFPTLISLKKAEQNVESLKDEMPPWQFKLVTAFIGSLREKMMKTGLHHNNLCLD